MNGVELIDRNALLTVLDEVFLKTDPDGEEQFGLLKARYIIRTAPAVDAASVRHGHWQWYRRIIVNDRGMHPVELSTCSLCGHFGHGNAYCDNCGAKMDGEDWNG